MATAAGICAALLARERTGADQPVSTSLLRTGVYVTGADPAVPARGESAGTRAHRIMGNPLLGAYCTQDDRWFWLLGR
jgi:crotonobetainyl-CoA:carnitine CoA-transferase CaiB-like acyl-CoA transferase